MPLDMVPLTLNTSIGALTNSTPPFAVAYKEVASYCEGHWDMLIAPLCRTDGQRHGGARMHAKRRLPKGARDKFANASAKDYQRPQSIMLLQAKAEFWGRRSRRRLQLVCQSSCEEGSSDGGPVLQRRE